MAASKLIKMAEAENAAGNVFPVRSQQISATPVFDCFLKRSFDGNKINQGGLMGRLYIGSSVYQKGSGWQFGASIVANQCIKGVYDWQ